MSKVQIDREALESLIDAAAKWAEEQIDYVIPDAWTDDDAEVLTMDLEAINKATVAGREALKREE